MKLLPLGLACALPGSFSIVAAEPTGATEPASQVLIEFVLMEVEGGSYRPILPEGHFSSLPKEGEGFSYVARERPDLESTLAALSKDTRVKVLQRPRIQTSHGTPATLVVGEVKQASAPDGKPQEVGLTLAVTPVIDASGVITMDLRMKQVQCDGKVWTKTGWLPITSSRETQTTLTLHDRETILMGGLTTSGRNTPAPRLSSPKDQSGAPSRANPSTSGETLLMVRPTLLRP